MGKDDDALMLLLGLLGLWLFSWLWDAVWNRWLSKSSSTKPGRGGDDDDEPDDGVRIAA